MPHEEPEQPKLTKIDNLLHYLRVITEIAASGYWLSTSELTLLLGFSPPQTQRFTWRNFTVIPVATQEHTQFWQIVAIPQELPKAPQSILPSYQEGEFIAAEYAWIENFLTAKQHQQLLAYVTSQQVNFQPSINTGNDDNYRRSMVLYHFPEFAELMNQRINGIVPYILTYLRLKSFNPSNIEIQLTLHNDGNFYKIHNDNGSADCATRVLTFVYYFFSEPKAFSGGELLLYDTKVANNTFVAAETFKTITPQNNCIIFFPSFYMHEVLPVSCPSQAFLDSRFTINGWIRS